MSPTATLDERISDTLRAFNAREVPLPQLLIASSTGTTGLVGALEDAVRVDFGEDGAAPLAVGRLGGRMTWVADIAADEAGGAPSWRRAFPIWLAAAAGARRAIHTCAGTSLGDGPAVGAIARISDHVNLSGRSPLTGLGESRLGPLFPDQTRVHDKALGDLAHRAAKARDVDTFDAVAACTIGPALATPAEFRWYSAAGADVAVQGLVDPLVASAHAGLSGLALCAITDRADETVDVATLVARSADVAPVLDAVVLDVAQSLEIPTREDLA